MVKSLKVILISGLLLSFLSCKSEFEKVRQSNDAQKILAKAKEYYEDEDYLKAQSLYEIVLSSYRGSQQGEEIYFDYAMTFYNMGNYASAAYHFDRFSATFPSSAKREEADYLRAYSDYLQSPNYRLDQTISVTAIEDFQTYINTYPNSDKVPQCNRLIDELRNKMAVKEFEVGNQYFHMNQYSSAVKSFQNLLIDYPDFDRIEEAQFLIVESSFEYAKNSVYDKKKERFLETQKYAQSFMKKYPDSQYYSKVASYLEDTNLSIAKLS